MFVSPMVSAALLGLTSIEIIFFIDVITAMHCDCHIACLFKVSVHEKAAEKQTTSYFSDFKLGITICEQPWFSEEFFIFFAIFFVLMAPAAFLTPLQVTRSFGDDVWRLSAIEIAFSIGMMAGGGDYRFLGRLPK